MEISLYGISMMEIIWTSNNLDQILWVRSILFDQPFSVTSIILKMANPQLLLSDIIGNDDIELEFLKEDRLMIRKLFSFDQNSQSSDLVGAFTQYFKNSQNLKDFYIFLLHFFAEVRPKQ